MLKVIFISYILFCLIQVAFALDDRRTIVNLNKNVDKSTVGNFVSNNNTPSGAGVIVIGPDEEGSGQSPVDHTRIVQMGFGIDPIFSCYFSNGSANKMSIVQNNEALCTFQARGCSDPGGCTLEGNGFGLSPSQFRIMACEDWTPAERCTRVQLSSTQKGTTSETAKVNWDDGGHIEYGNFVPKVANGCGSGASIEGTDNAFRIRIGDSPSSTCAVDFHNAWTLAYKGTNYRPICTVNNETRDAFTRVIPSSTQILIMGNLAKYDDVSVLCVGFHDLP